jgi:hypothetical protein
LEGLRDDDGGKERGLLWIGGSNVSVVIVEDEDDHSLGVNRVGRLHRHICRSGVVGGERCPPLTGDLVPKEDRGLPPRPTAMARYCQLREQCVYFNPPLCQYYSLSSCPIVTLCEA